MSEEKIRGLASVPPESEPDGVMAVLKALYALGKEFKIDPRDAVDPDHVADLLFDYGDDLGPSQVLYLLSVLQVDRLQELTTQACDRQYLFLNVAGLADEAVVHLYAGYCSGAREVPFRSWARRAVAEVTRRAVSDPDLAPFNPNGANPGEKVVMAIMGHKINQMEFEARRLIWLSWIERRSLREIVEQTGVSLERVEWILAGVIDESKQVVSNLFSGNFPINREDPKKEEEDEHEAS